VVPSAYLYDKCSEPSAIVLAWGENEECKRETPIAIHSIDNKYPKRFHKFNLWAGQNLEKKRKGKSVSIIGLRAEESPDRRFCLEKTVKCFGLKKNTPHKAYPIIDWKYTDVWKYLIENKYNKSI
jgi:predicted phosphoadenosine phosphosulfate sulfurtransferase